MLSDVAKIFTMILLVASSFHIIAGSSRNLTKMVGQEDAGTRSVADSMSLGYKSAKHVRNLKQTLESYECFLTNQKNCETSSQPISADVAESTGYVSDNNITGSVCATDYSSASQLCNQFCSDVISEAKVDDSWSMAVLSVQVDADPNCSAPNSTEYNVACPLGLGSDCTGGSLLDTGDG